MAIVKMRVPRCSARASNGLHGAACGGCRPPAKTLHGVRRAAHDGTCGPHRLPDRAKQFHEVRRRAVKTRPRSRSPVCASRVDGRKRSSESPDLHATTRTSKNASPVARRPLIDLILEPEENVDDANNLISLESEEEEEEEEMDAHDMANSRNLEREEQNYMSRVVDWPGSPCSSSGSCSPEPELHDIATPRTMDLLTNLGKSGEGSHVSLGRPASQSMQFIVHL